MGAIDTWPDVVVYVGYISRVIFLFALVFPLLRYHTKFLPINGQTFVYYQHHMLGCQVMVPCLACFVQAGPLGVVFLLGFPFPPCNGLPPS